MIEMEFYFFIFTNHKLTHSDGSAIGGTGTR